MKFEAQYEVLEALVTKLNETTTLVENMEICMDASQHYDRKENRLVFQ